MKLRIVTWNLWGFGAPGPYLQDRAEFRGALPGSNALQAFDGAQVWKHRRPLLTRALNTTEPHLICVQECLGAETPLAHHLAADLGLNVYDDVQSPGLAIITNLPVKECHTLSNLKADWFGYSKPLHLIANIASRDVSILCVHIPLNRYGSRDQLIKELSAWQSPTGDTILAGDLNAAPSDAVIKTLLTASYLDVSAPCGPTMPNPFPVVRLDYILVRNAFTNTVLTTATEVLGLEADKDGFLPSDHAGIAVELEWNVVHWN